MAGKRPCGFPRFLLAGSVFLLIFLLYAANEHLEKRRERGQRGLHFYLAFSHNVFTVLQARPTMSPMLLWAFPKGSPISIKF